MLGIALFWSCRVIEKWHCVNTSLSKNSSWNNCTEPMTFVLYGSLLMSIAFYLQSVGLRAINSISLVLKDSPLTGGIRFYKDPSEYYQDGQSIISSAENREDFYKKHWALAGASCLACISSWTWTRVRGSPVCCTWLAGLFLSSLSCDFKLFPILSKLLSSAANGKCTVLSACACPREVVPSPAA